MIENMIDMTNSRKSRKSRKIDGKIYTMILIILIINVFGIIIVSGEENINSNLSNQSSTKYISFVDLHGFYRVVNMSSNGPEPYNNNTFRIHKGDIVTWVNDEITEKRLTIISVQKLWENESGLLGARDKQFSYTFNKTGTYTVYIKEYPELKQKIIIRSMANQTTKTNTTKNTTKTKTNKTSEIKKKKSDAETIKIVPIYKDKSDNTIIILLAVIILLSIIFVIYKYEKDKKMKDK